MTTVTVDDILDAIRLAAPSVADPEGALTTAEWMAKTGFLKRKMEVTIRNLMAAGRMRRVPVKRERIDGAWVTYPAYQLVTGKTRP